MGSFRNQLETRIADLFGYSDAVLFGRARSGVVALVDILGLNRGAPFIMPSNLCPSLLIALHSCGAKAHLAGVCKSNGLASDAALVEAMHAATQPGIVMPTHLYGFVQPYPKTVASARTRGWFVLENDTMATRARLDGAERSAFGDALLVSFGYAKTIEAGGGGAMLTDNVALARELRSRAQAFPLLDDAAQKAEEEFMLLGRRLYNRQTETSGLSAGDREAMLFEHAPDCQYRFPDGLEQGLSNALTGFQDAIADKREKLKMWKYFLAPFDHALFAPEADCVVPWRLIRRAPGIRDTIVTALRNDGIDAGTNFPPLNNSFPGLFSGQHFADAEQWGREVLNLWLAPAYDAARMKRAADIIGTTLSQPYEISQ